MLLGLLLTCYTYDHLSVGIHLGDAIVLVEIVHHMHVTCKEGKGKGVLCIRQTQMLLGPLLTCYTYDHKCVSGWCNSTVLAEIVHHMYV